MGRKGPWAPCGLAAAQGMTEGREGQGRRRPCAGRPVPRLSRLARGHGAQQPAPVPGGGEQERATRVPSCGGHIWIRKPTCWRPWQVDGAGDAAERSFWGETVIPRGSPAIARVGSHLLVPCDPNGNPLSGNCNYFRLTLGKLRLRGAGHVPEAGEQGSLPDRKPCSRGQRRQDGALRGVRVTEAAPRGASARDPFRGSRGTSGLSSRAPWPPGGPRAPDSDPGVYLPVSTKAAIQGSYFLRADPHWGSQGPPAPAGRPSRPVAQLGAKTLSESHSAYGRLIRDFQS